MGSTPGEERFSVLWKEFEAVRSKVLEQNPTDYAKHMMELAPKVLLPTVQELDGSDSPLDSYIDHVQGQEDTMLEIIADQQISAQHNLLISEDEPLSLVVSLVGEEPWDDLWPKSKRHFYVMDTRHLLQLAGFFHMLDGDVEKELSQEDLQRLEIIIGLRHG